MYVSYYCLIEKNKLNFHKLNFWIYIIYVVLKITYSLLNTFILFEYLKKIVLANKLELILLSIADR